jgi:hypothetical protein
MEIDWTLSKKITLWHFEDLIVKILGVFSYTFVQEHYNNDMNRAESYARLTLDYLQKPGEKAFLNQIVRNIKKLKAGSVANWLDLVHRVESREKCEGFLAAGNFSFEELLHTLNYLFRWVLPFKHPLKEYIKDGDESYLKLLNQHGIKTNLDLLEIGRSRPGRSTLSSETGIPEPFLQELTHRADVSRLPYVRGKTVLHLCGGGYDTVEKLANADLERMEADMEAYYRQIGKTSADYKAAIPLYWMAGGAAVLPQIVEA